MFRRLRQLAKRATEGEVYLTPRFEKVVQMACQEARQLDDHYAETEHLLLGLVRESEGVARESEGVAAQVLADLGVSYEEVRRRVLEERGY